VKWKLSITAAAVPTTRRRSAVQCLFVSLGAKVRTVQKWSSSVTMAIFSILLSAAADRPIAADKQIDYAFTQITTVININNISKVNYQ